MYFTADTMSVDQGFDTLDYGYAPTQAALRHTVSHSERNLWCAVIAQAFVDIGALKASSQEAQPEPPAGRGREYDEAVRWLLRDNGDFAYICEMAGVSPNVIRHAARLFYGQCRLARCLE